MGSSQELETRDSGLLSAVEKGTPAVAPAVAPGASVGGQDAVIEATELEVESALEKEKDEEHTNASFAHFIVGSTSAPIIPSLTN
jgi:hypothetical protein